MSNINFDEVRKIMETQEPIKPTPATSDDTDVDMSPVGSDWMNPNKTVVNKVEHKYEPTTTTTPDPEYIYKPEPEGIYRPDPYVAPIEPNDVPSTYHGPGLVVNHDDLVEMDKPLGTYTGITPDSQSSIDDYLKEMDLAIDELKEEKERIMEEQEIIQAEEDDIIKENDDDISRANEFNEKYNEAVVIIDKTGFGQTINFTDEEREKLETVKKIKLEEIENVEIDVLKTKKVKKKSDFRNIIKKHINKGITTQVVLPISGYTATLAGCSAYELANLVERDQDPLRNAQAKWSLLHSKLESTSIGNMDFNEFLSNTAASDYNTLVYGILCSTYPDDDYIPLTCEHCKKDFKHGYSTRSLIRVENMSDRLKDAIATAVDASVNAADAKEAHSEALVNVVKKIKLPASEIIAEIYVQSAYDFINKTIKEIANLKDDKYNNAAIMSTLVRTLYIPDEDEPGTYFEIDTTMEIVEVIYSLSDTDVRVIAKLTENLLNDMDIEYGFMNIKCPHCGHFTETFNFDIETLLFHRYRQALEQTIE